MDSILRAIALRSAPLRFFSTRTDAPKPHLTIFPIWAIFLRNSTKHFFSAAGGVHFRFCWLAIYQFLEFLVIIGTCASQFARQGRRDCAKRLYESRVMQFSVRKPSRLGLLRKSLMPLFLLFWAKTAIPFFGVPPFEYLVFLANTLLIYHVLCINPPLIIWAYG